MHQRSSLDSREDGFIQFVLCRKLFAGKNHTTTRSTKCLMCCCCRYMSVWDRALVNAGSYQTCDMCHVYHQESSYFICDLTETFKINLTAVSTCSCDDHFRFTLFRDALYFIIIDKSCVIYSVRYDMIIRS